MTGPHEKHVTVATATSERRPRTRLSRTSCPRPISRRRSIHCPGVDVPSVTPAPEGSSGSTSSSRMTTSLSGAYVGLFAPMNPADIERSIPSVNGSETSRRSPGVVTGFSSPSGSEGRSAGTSGISSWTATFPSVARTGDRGLPRPRAFGSKAVEGGIASSIWSNRVIGSRAFGADRDHVIGVHLNRHEPRDDEFSGSRSSGRACPTSGVSSAGAPTSTPDHGYPDGTNTYRDAPDSAGGEDRSFGFCHVITRCRRSPHNPERRFLRRPLCSPQPHHPRPRNVRH